LRHFLSLKQLCGNGFLETRLERFEADLRAVFGYDPPSSEDVVRSDAALS